VSTVALARRSGDLKDKRQAWRDFWQRQSPRCLAAATVIALALRLALGHWTWHDAAAVVAMAIVYPFGEWAIHVYLLHLRPFRFRGRMVELPTAYAHREHHERPDRMGLILLGPVEVFGLVALMVPLVVTVGTVIVGLVFGFPPLAALVTAALTSYVLIFGYEWMHFLIHTAYRPKTALYRAIWQNHRLHHFKNEHYWHGVTNTFADRVLRTRPNHHEVGKSATATTLGQ
jgi:hypothetical protein